MLPSPADRIYDELGDRPLVSGVHEHVFRVAVNEWACLLILHLVPSGRMGEAAPSIGANVTFLLPGGSARHAIGLDRDAHLGPMPGAFLPRVKTGLGSGLVSAEGAVTFGLLTHGGGRAVTSSVVITSRSRYAKMLFLGVC